jgi:quercetin dioxygenase-like cupin family protein
MQIQYPHTIESCVGEKITFVRAENGPEGEKIFVENWVQPGCGPLMHTHFLQEESLTVVSGRIGYQLFGGPEQFAGPGETVLFMRNIPHRFWNAGNDVLYCTGYVSPANTVVYFLTALFAAQNKSGSERPETFDGAYLLSRYSGEYDLSELPSFVKKVIFPLIVFVGKLLGKYPHFKDAPKSVRR